MKESEVTSKVIKLLNGVPDCRAKKRASGKFGGGDPDLLGVFRGAAFFIEMKILDSGMLTLLQANQLELWRRAGAATFVGIYAPAIKHVDFIRLDADQYWANFVNPTGIKTLWTEHPGLFRNKIKDFEFKNWLESSHWKNT